MLFSDSIVFNYGFPDIISPGAMPDSFRSALSADTSRPRIIQGGMGISVSSWRLARAVAGAGEIGVVSATAIDSVLVRELQDGDPNGRLESLADYPDQEIVEFLAARYFIDGGLEADSAYRLLPMHRFRPTTRSQRILSAAAYSEVRLAKQGHDGYVGINLLCELKRYTLASLYGAMLAGVDAIMIGAGIPLDEGRLLQDLADGKPCKLRFDVDTSQAKEEAGPFYYHLDPADLVPEVVPLERPDFYPIIASDTLARVLNAKLPEGIVTGWIIEGPIAGGHNAPPRNKAYDDDRNPIYDDRDVADLSKVARIGLPFYLAGGFGSPERVAEAMELGAAGVQIGSLFSLSDESGYPAEYKRNLIGQIHLGLITIRTDGRVSPTGFPFKVVEVEGTNGIPEVYDQRTRMCDLGYLQEAYLDEKGRLLARCASEPVDEYVQKGGNVEDTDRRGCLCNGLMSNLGQGQRRASGDELPLFTGGDELLSLPLGSVEKPSYSAVDVLEYLLAYTVIEEGPA